MPGDSDESLRAPNPLRNPNASFENIGICPQESSGANWKQQWVKTDEWEKNGGRTIVSWPREQFKLGSIAAAQSLTVDPSFLDYICLLKAMKTEKRVLIPIYEMLAKEIEGYIKCFDINVVTWVIIVRVGQVQEALKSQLQRHGSCLHRLDNVAKVSLRKGWWQTGERTKIKAQHSHEIWVSKSLETDRATFQASDIKSNLRWMPDRINASPCLQRYLDALPNGEYFGKEYQVVATGSLRLNRSSTKEPVMSAGVMWHDAAIPHRSERVLG